MHSLSNSDRFAYLEKLAAEAPGVPKLFEADLMKEGSFDAAMKGCSTVFHVASPFMIEVDDPQTQLVEPAVNGTRSAL